MPSGDALYGGVEAGGTKFVCLAGTGPDDVRAIERFPTEAPEITLRRVLDFFAGLSEGPSAVGIGSFGPVDLDTASPTWGFITSTPKPGWQQTDFGGFVGRELGVPVAFDTDVNAAAMGEMTWGAARATTDCLYITVGTGVGGGAVVGRSPVHGLVHPEMGHVRVPRAPGDDFAGACPYHGDCLEGMVAGPAIRARAGRPGEELADDDPIWSIVAHYLAHAIVNFVCTLSPQRIVVGGGIAKRPTLLPEVRSQVQQLLNGYVQSPTITEHIDAYIVAPALGDRAGALGALAMAKIRDAR